MLYITVPDMNDSVSSLTIADKEYLIRFTYNGTGDFLELWIIRHKQQSDYFSYEDGT